MDGTYYLHALKQGLFVWDSLLNTIITIVQMKKLEFREVTQFVQGHTANRKAEFKIKLG